MLELEDRVKPDTIAGMNHRRSQSDIKFEDGEEPYLNSDDAFELPDDEVIRGGYSFDSDEDDKDSDLKKHTKRWEPNYGITNPPKPKIPKKETEKEKAERLKREKEE